MYISHISSYVPEIIVTNDYLSKINGLSEEWMQSRTGIRERRKAPVGENTHTMALEAIKKLLESPPCPPEEIDLIVGGTYTPHDTIHTLAHAAQNFLNISDIPVISLSTACSSFANVMELIQGYFAMNKARRALAIVSDHNTAYSNETDQVGGHLWGDGAAALLISRERLSEKDVYVRDIITGGAGNVGKAPEGVFLKPIKEGFVMKHGRDVFQYACQYMTTVTRKILERNNYQLGDLDYFIPHQANLRITQNVARNLELDNNRALSNIEYLGNTGCAGCTIALHEHWHRFRKGDVIVVTVFGGGYSYGSLLLEC
ncbi:MAG: ketoacyl-ACP synthase III [Bacteroidia bacterium]|nr:ketoacyl-ACP synthase III [Bacteroidia bacterium]